MKNKKPSNTSGQRTRPRTSGTEWVGGRVVSPFYVTEGTPYRPELDLWLEMPDALVVFFRLSNPKEPPVSFGATLLDAMKSPMLGSPRRPDTVRVADGLQAEEVRRILPEARIVVAPTPELDEVLQLMSKSASEDGEGQEPSYLEAGRIGEEALESLFRSAEILYKLAPWQVASDSQVLRVDIPAYGVAGACLSITGALGESLGLILFPSLADFETFLDKADQPHPPGSPIDMGTNALSLNFEEGSDLPAGMLREVLDHGWPVACAKAYPVVCHYDRDGVMRPLTERDVRIASACAASLSAFFVKHRALFKREEFDPICESYFDDDDIEVRFTVPPEAAHLFKVNKTRPQRRNVPAPRLQGEPGGATSMPVGRNQPCPCGSGKKYKLCCMQEKSRADTDGDDRRTGQDAEEAPAAHHDVDSRLVERMDRYACGRFGSDWMVRPARIFGDLTMPGALMGPWSFHHHLFNGKSIAEWFLEDQGARLPKAELDWLRAQRAAWLSVWEVLEVNPGKGLSLKDLLTGETRSVWEVMASKSLNRRDAVLARVVDHQGQSVLCGVYHRSLPPRDAADVVARVQGRLGRKCTVPVERLRGEAIGRYLIACWEEALEEADLRARRPRKLTNTDGDPLLLTVDHFTFDPADRVEIQRHLATVEGMVAESAPSDPEQVYVFTRPDDPMHRDWGNTVIGRIVFSGNALRVESNSVKRADALRELVESSLGHLIHQRVREHVDPLAQLREEGPTARAASPKPSVEEADRLLLELKAKHYADWVDHPIPALGNEAPRAAVRTKAGRQQVDLLLKECENLEARLPAGQRFDFGRIRQELGLE